MHFFCSLFSCCTYRISVHGPIMLNIGVKNVRYARCLHSSFVLECVTARITSSITETHVQEKGSHYFIKAFSSCLPVGKGTWMDKYTKLQFSQLVYVPIFFRLARLAPSLCVLSAGHVIHFAVGFPFPVQVQTKVERLIYTFSKVSFRFPFCAHYIFRKKRHWGKNTYFPYGQHLFA